jgi:hypothetical protein
VAHGDCNGCGEDRSLRYGLCWNCRLVPYSQRPLVREGRAQATRLRLRPRLLDPDSGGDEPAVPASEEVNGPSHYGGAENPYEAIKVIEQWDLGFRLGNAVKYIARAGKKDSAKLVQDLRKALWYLQREIDWHDGPRDTAQESSVAADVVAKLRDQVRGWRTKCEDCVGRIMLLETALRLTQEYVGDEVLPRQPGWAWYDALHPGEPPVPAPKSIDPDGSALGRRVSDEPTFAADEWRVIATALLGLANQFEDSAMHEVIARLRTRAQAAADGKRQLLKVVVVRKLGPGEPMGPGLLGIGGPRYDEAADADMVIAVDFETETGECLQVGVTGKMNAKVVVGR